MSERDQFVKSGLRKLAVSRRALLCGGVAAITTGIVSGPNCVWARDDKPAALDEVREIEVAARPIRSFERTGGAGRQFGKLEFRGGLVMTSPAKEFGGLSGIVVDPGGRKFFAVSDETGWLSGDIRYDGNAPAGLANVRMGPIRALAGRLLDRKKDLDAEAVTLLDGTLARGTLLIGFERNHRIGRFPIVDGVISNPTGYLKPPPEARRMRQNKGYEAVAAIRGGAFKGSVIAFSERFPGTAGVHTGWIWVNGEPQRLTIPDVDDFDITDAASLSDGAILVLERRFRWSDWTEGIKMRLRRIAAADLRPGTIGRTETLIEANLSKEIDNMEGLSVHQGANGETVLTMVSDNNFNSFLQRTLLLQFTLNDGADQAQRP